MSVKCKAYEFQGLLIGERLRRCAAHHRVIDERSTLLIWKGRARAKATPILLQDPAVAILNENSSCLSANSFQKNKSVCERRKKNENVSTSKN